MTTNNPPRKTIRELFEEGTPIDEALRRGVEDALRRHRQLGQTVVVWRDGKVVRLRPEEIPVPPATDARSPD